MTNTNTTTVLGSVMITAVLANGMPVKMIQHVSNENVLDDFREMYAELVKLGKYQTATVEAYGYRTA
jgi:hypothetical protein